MKKLLVMLFVVVAMLTVASAYPDAPQQISIGSVEEVEYKFKVGDRVLWGGYSCIVSYTGPITNLDGKLFDAYALQQLAGPMEFTIRYKGFVEKTAILEKVAGSKEFVPIILGGDWPPRCDPLPPPCL